MSLFLKFFLPPTSFVLQLFRQLCGTMQHFVQRDFVQPVVADGMNESVRNVATNGPFRSVFGDGDKSSGGIKFKHGPSLPPPVPKDNSGLRSKPNPLESENYVSQGKQKGI